MFAVSTVHMLGFSLLQISVQDFWSLTHSIYIFAREKIGVSIGHNVMQVTGSRLVLHVLV